MWPMARGSLQPVRAPKEAVVKPYSNSAPQLTAVADSAAGASARVSIHRRPALCFHRVLSPEQLAALDTLSTDDALILLSADTPGLAVLLYSVYRWGSEQGLSADELSVLLTLHHDAYRYFTESPWRTQGELYAFFKENLLCHSVRHSPHSERVFTPQQSKDCLLYFCHRVMTVLPLVRLVTLPNLRLRLIWHQEERLVKASLL